jgi:hypothetical protein
MARRPSPRNHFEWDSGWPAGFWPRAASGNWRAAEKLFRERRQGDAALTAKALARLISAEPNRLVAIDEELVSETPRLKDHHFGVTLEQQGRAGRRRSRQSVGAAGRDRQIARSLIKLLEANGVYAGDKGHAGTSQIGRPLLIKGALVQKPRFWLFRAKALVALANASDGQEQRSVNRL